MERFHVFDAARDQGRRHEARVIENEHLFGGIHDFARIVDHQGGPFQPVEQESGADVAEVEGRILPHQHHVDVAGQIDLAPLLRFEMIALLASDPHGHSVGRDPAAWRIIALPGEGSDIVLIDRVAARLRRLHQGERRIAGNVDVFERVHLDRDAQAHSFFPMASRHWRCGEAERPAQGG